MHRLPAAPGAEASSLASRLTITAERFTAADRQPAPRQHRYRRQLSAVLAGLAFGDKRALTNARTPASAAACSTCCRTPPRCNAPARLQSGAAELVLSPTSRRRDGSGAVAPLVMATLACRFRFRSGFGVRASLVLPRSGPHSRRGVRRPLECRRLHCRFSASDALSQPPGASDGLIL